MRPASRQNPAARHKLADSLMQAGKAADALPIYLEVQKLDPSYTNIDQDIQAAMQGLSVEDLYQQGTQAMQAAETGQALALFLKIEQLHPQYKDTPQLIAKIKGEQQIASLIQDIHGSYAQGDWARVVHDYEAIQQADPSMQLPELNDELFFSYENLIIDITGRKDPSVADIETAARYYRLALALLPQTAQYSNSQERAKFEKLAADIVTSRYYLQGIGLLESSNYSNDALQQSLRDVQLAASSGAGSAVFRAGIEKAGLFLNAYNSLAQRKWDPGINDLESLYRKDQGYAGGRVPYFLYEAYTARGDLLLANAGLCRRAI